MSGELARQWFVSGEGIDRHVIVADIQRYLGNDATVRPGLGTGENQGVPGFWIKAYRNLTTAMISDLRATSGRWSQEQKMSGTRGGYVESHTHRAAQAGRITGARGGNSPSADLHASGRPSNRIAERVPERIPERMPERMPNRMPDRMTERVPDRRAYDRMDVDSMQIDPPMGQDRRQPQDRAGYAADPRQYPPAERFGADPRSSGYRAPEPAGFDRSQPMSGGAYGQDPSYGRSSLTQPAADGPPPGYVRQGNFYVPVSTYDQQSSMLARADPPFGNTYGQPAPPALRDIGRDNRDYREPPRHRDDPRDMRGDPRDAVMRDSRDAVMRDPRDARMPQDYAQDPRDARYAYPSPAATVTSLRDRDPPSQQSGYGMPSGYGNQYGGDRPAPGQTNAVFGSSTQPLGFGRSQQPLNDDRDVRRRRLQ